MNEKDIYVELLSIGDKQEQVVEMSKDSSHLLKTIIDAVNKPVEKQ